MVARRHEFMALKLIVFLVVGWLQVASIGSAATTTWSEISSEVGSQQDQERSYLSGDSYTYSQSPSKFKTTINGLLQVYTSSSNRPFAGGKQDALKLLRSAAQVIPQQQQQQQQQQLSSSNMMNTVEEYRCANYCSCSVIQVMDKSNEKRANLTQVRCESSQFTDLLTIDRQTHIIHISLPTNKDDYEATGHLSTSGAQLPLGGGGEDKRKRQFRMPRLNQFNLLKEIVIINLQFEICDSEVFKKGQKMRRLQLNHNRLSRISKACLKHLDKLVELNLDYNQLSELESALFNSLLSLRSLSIAHNQLTELAAHQFANLTNLISLNLVGNLFKSINLQLFEPMQSSLRLLLLAKNQIKSFVQAPVVQATVNINPNVTATTHKLSPNKSSQITNSTLKVISPFVGVVFKNLIKLNVDENKFERIKLLQLHRFFNVKYLSIRQNNIATIRDKAFNGLKLIELNLAHNQLQTVSKCAFCNATIKRLVLSYNNISLPLSGGDALTAPVAPLTPLTSSPVSIVPRPLALNGSSLGERPNARSSSSSLPEPLAQQSDQPSVVQSGSQNSQPSQAISSPNMLILSQSIFGPLFSQLEYLDLSNNQLLSDQLELLLEPLLKLEYLNLASVGLDRYLPSPTMFKNLRQLKYLNLSHNQLDQLVAETVEPLTSLEVLDLSHNKFSEMEESFLVTIDEMLTALKVINLGSNPWFCSQCKVAPLYDWILRSPLYNVTCIYPSLSSSAELPATSDEMLAPDAGANEAGTSASGEEPVLLGRRLARGPQHYSLLVDSEDAKLEPVGDIDLILGNSLDDEIAGHYNLLASDYLYNGGSGQVLGQLPLNGPLLRELASSEDDTSIGLTMLQVSGAAQRHYSADEYCLKCEFPGELRSFNIHELQANDFKFCAGAAPRFSASEPKIGLTLAIVIIGALFCIIVIVIVMYRKKSNTYYTNEDTDQLDGGVSGSGGKKPVFSISSDVEHQYGDNTDYSSPPMSQSFDSYSDEDRADDLDEEEEEEEEEEEDDEEDDEEMDDEDEEFDEENELDEEEEAKDVGDETKGTEEATTSVGIPGGHDNERSARHKAHGAEHHVGYANEVEAQSRREVDEQMQANARRAAAAEVERRHQLAEYHKNERATLSSQRTSQSQGSSLSPADRSASGPIFNHQQSGAREPTKRQTSATHSQHNHQRHHQQNHNHRNHGGQSTRSRPVVAAAAVAVAVATTEKLAKEANTTGSTTPSLAASATQSSSQRGEESPVAGGHRTTRTPAHQTASIKRIASGSQSQSQSNSLELGIRVPLGGNQQSKISRATVSINNEPHERNQQSSREPLLPVATAAATSIVAAKVSHAKANENSSSVVDSRQASLERQHQYQHQHQHHHHQTSQDRRRAMRTPQTSDHRSKLKAAQGSGSQHHQTSLSGSSKPPLVEQPSGIERPSGLAVEKPPALQQQQHQHQHHSSQDQPQSAHTVTGTSRLGRQRFVVSKEQKSQPATEWSHLRPTVQPPAAPHSLGVEPDAILDNSNGDLGPDFGTLPVARQAVTESGERPSAQRHHHHQQQQQPQPIAVGPTERRHRSPSSVSDATTADSLALEALSYTASDLDELANEVGGALEMNSSGSFGPDEFVNNNNNNNNNNSNSNIINESNNNNSNSNNHHHHHNSSTHSGRLQAASLRMRHSHSNHSALTQGGTSSRDEL